MLTNLMFETIGSTTYRIAIGRVKQPAIRSMLFVLMRDESFHVPLNVHFLREILARVGHGRLRRLKLRLAHRALFVTLVSSTIASRRAAAPFDRISTVELASAYAQNLARLFAHERDLDLAPPWPLLRALGIDRARLADGASPSSVAVAEAAAEREPMPAAFT
jgi:hypothetical protein